MVQLNVYHHALVAFLVLQLSSSLKAEVLSELPTAVQSAFIEKNQLIANAADMVEIQSVGKVLSNKCAEGISLDGLERYSRIFDGMICKGNDNDMTCPEFDIFRKVRTIGGKRVTVTATKENGNFKKVQIATSDCIQYFDGISGLSRSRSSDSVDQYLASTPKEAYLNEAFVGEEATVNSIVNTNVRKLLRENKNASGAHRELAGCSAGPNAEVEVALAIDSSFCENNNNNFNDAMSSVAATFAFSVGLYEASTCLTLHLKYMEAYCGGTTGPYRGFVDSDITGCDGNTGLVQQFQEYWWRNRARRVDAHISQLVVHNNKLSAGCASIPETGLCEDDAESNRKQIGFNNLVFSNIAQRSTVMAHEFVRSEYLIAYNDVLNLLVFCA